VKAAALEMKGDATVRESCRTGHERRRNRGRAALQRRV